MNKKLDSEIQSDFAEFMSGSLNPPNDLSNKVKIYINTKLHPNAWLVFSKLSFLHLIGGMLTLIVCPQFGINIFGHDYGITRYLFKLGPYGCTIACGALFIGVTVTLAVVFLAHAEIGKIKKHWPLQILAIGLLSLGSFIMLDADILFSFGLAWIVGGFIGGISILEIGLFLRRSVLAH